MATTLTTNFGLPKPPLGAVGVADGYDTLMDAADAAIKAALDGKLNFVIKTDTGHPATPSVPLVEINTFDNKVYIYADGDWRQLATW